MTDVFSRRKRSEIMSHVKSNGNLATERRLISIFRKKGIKGWRRHTKNFGNPDFVFPEVRLAVFIDGCFWHCCPKHGEIPGSNSAFWAKKLDANHRRDRLVNRTLSKQGWRVIRIWQHDLKTPDRVFVKINSGLK